MRSTSEISDRLARVEAKLDAFGNRLEHLEANQVEILKDTSTVELLVKFVVLPLIAIVGALVGVKIAFP